MPAFHARYIKQLSVALVFLGSSTFHRCLFDRKRFRVHATEDRAHAALQLASNDSGWQTSPLPSHPCKMLTELSGAKLSGYLSHHRPNLGHVSDSSSPVYPAVELEKYSVKRELGCITGSLRFEAFQIGQPIKLLRSFQHPFWIVQTVSLL